MLTISTAWTMLAAQLRRMPRQQHARVPQAGIVLMLKEREETALQILNLEKRVQELQKKLQELPTIHDVEDGEELDLEVERVEDGKVYVRQV